MQLRIGSRDPNTGLYNVIYPDGSQTTNGIKIYNAEHQIGDVVRATNRNDGMIILDGSGAAENLTASAAGNANGYNFGQVFNSSEQPLRGLAFITTFDAFIAAQTAGAFPTSIANIDPGVQNLIWTQSDYDYSDFAIVYPKSSQPTRFILRISTNALPATRVVGNPDIEGIYLDPSFDELGVILGTGAADQRLQLFWFAETIVNPAANTINGGEIQIELPGSLSSPYRTWQNFNVMRLSVSSVVPHSTPFAGNFVSVQLVYVSNCSLGNSFANVAISI